MRLWYHPGTEASEGEIDVEPRLATFLAVARAGRLSEAARRTNMSASNVSQQISSLESDFGVRLFVRSNRGMVLTPAGAALRLHAERIEASWRQAYRSVRHAMADRPSTHIAASQTVAEIFLPRPLGAFRRAHPDVGLSLTMANSEIVASQVANGQVDFGVVEGPAVSGYLRTVALWRDELALIAPDNHPLAARGTVSIADLVETDLILREPGSGTRTILEKALDEAGYGLSALHVAMELSSLRAITAMVSCGVGVSVVSRRVATAAAPGGRALVFLPIEGVRLERQITALGRDPDDLEPAARALLALLIRDGRSPLAPA